MKQQKYLNSPVGTPRWRSDLLETLRFFAEAAASLCANGSCDAIASLRARDNRSRLSLHRFIYVTHLPTRSPATRDFPSGFWQYFWCGGTQCRQTPVECSSATAVGSGIAVHPIWDSLQASRPCNRNWFCLPTLPLVETRAEAWKPLKTQSRPALATGQRTRMSKAWPKGVRA